MKKVFMALSCLALIVSCAGKKPAGGEKQKSFDLVIVEGTPDAIDSLSYCLGVNMGYSLKMQMAQFVPVLDSCIKSGLTENLNGTSKLPLEESRQTLQNFFSNDEFRSKVQKLMAQQRDTTAVAEPIQIFANDAEAQKISYALGYDMGHNLRQHIQDEIHIYWVVKGFGDGFDEKPQFPLEEVGRYMQNYIYVVTPRRNAEASAAWLAEKEALEGVKKSESGLLYRIVEEGDMTKAATQDYDTVKVHYTGRLKDGKVFDASKFANHSKERQEMIRQQYPYLFDENGNYNEPEEGVEFPLNGVIKGWTEGMKYVGKGGKIILYIPSELAYGERGNRGIAPNEALEFEVEILDVKPGKASNE